MINIDKIIECSSLISPYIHNTPILKSDSINELFSCEISFKCENFQKVGAFKYRGATNAILCLPKEKQKNGVITHSSGNHAQALSLAAKMQGIPAYIIMPETSSQVKIDAVKSYGGNITFCKPNLQARESTAHNVKSITRAEFIHPYDNEHIITGQATASYEVFMNSMNFDVIMTPVGGGGLLSGTALTTKLMTDSISVFGAEPQNANDAYHSFYSGNLVPSVNPDTIADGLLTSLGLLNFNIIRKYVDKILCCSEISILKAMTIMYERLKIVVEPSAAVPLACLIDNKDLFLNKKLCIIVSGGNIDLQNFNWLIYK